MSTVRANTLPGFLADVTSRYADRVAIRFEGRSVSYRDLAEGAANVAGGLAAAGIEPGEHVAVMMGNRPEWVTAAYGAAAAGCVVVPVSTFATPDERNAILAHSDAVALLTQPTLGKRDYAAELAATPPPDAVRRVFTLGVDELAGPAPKVDASPDDVAIILYTSGTSAAPKAIEHTHRVPVAQSYHWADYLRYAPDDRLLTTQPFFWSAGFAMSMGSALAAGASMVLQELFDPAAALAAIEEERVTAILSWPHQDRAMADHPEARSRDLSSVAKLDFDSPLAAVVGLERDEWGKQGAYGLSETFTVVSNMPADGPAELRHSTHGKPLPGVEVRIVDGEITVKGPMLMRGYYKADPSSVFDADGFFHTKDAGFVDEDGYLHWEGRRSELIKTGGANVSPLEIQRALDGCPGIRVGVAVGVPHETLGEAVVLCAVPSDGATVDETEIRAYLRDKLAAYKVPRRVLAFRNEEVSYTGTDKVRVEPLRLAAIERLTPWEDVRG